MDRMKEQIGKYAECHPVNPVILSKTAFPALMDDAAVSYPPASAGEGTRDWYPSFPNVNDPPKTRV